MSPTIFREKGYRFFFFSLEETRMHVHVRSPDGEAKYWLEPDIALARKSRLSNVQLNEIQRMVEAHRDELIAAWRKHFPDSSN
ncbi:MAG: DUF4160 domain-containing protein, partial [Pseudomonadales bacterium]|nr:DUF4160 domain-containing protein [Pseudomonadales bacterium]